MQYNLLTQELAGRPRDLVLLLAQEARDAAPVPWAASELRRRALLALLRDPDNVPNVLRAAREAAAETPDRLGSEGRAFFALLAVCAGDGDAARRLHEPTARTGVESRLAQSLARELSIFGNVLARVGKTDQARSIWRTALGLCPEKPEAAGKLRKALQQKLAEPPKAP